MEGQVSGARDQVSGVRCPICRDDLKRGCQVFARFMWLRPNLRGNGTARGPLQSSQGRKDLSQSQDALPVGRSFGVPHKTALLGSASNVPK